VPFRIFMLQQHIKTLQNELNLYENKNKKNPHILKNNFMMFF